MSAEIKCPACGQTFKVDESLYANIVKQVRDSEFTADLEERVRIEKVQAKTEATLEREKMQAEISDLRTKLEAEQKQARAQLEAEKKQAQASLDATQKQAVAERDLAVQNATADLREKLSKAEADFEIERQKLQGQINSYEAHEKTQQQKFLQQLESAELKAKNEHVQLKAQLEGESLQLKAQLDNERAQFSAQLESAQTQLKSQLKNERVQHEKQLENERAQHTTQLKGERARHATELEKQQAQHELQLEKKLSELKGDLESERRAKDEIIRLKDEEIERVKEYKSSLSTKGLGESLEQYCSQLYEQYLRPTLLGATFEKDTKAVEGTKGDFIFRDFDDAGEEYISIEFEMKTEADTTTADMRHTNESHMKKLDADRKKKDCEYAVLVSTLEPDSALYNQGIVDVSWKYPKMYVIRPQFFVPLITLLRNAAREGLRYRTELSQVKQTNIDVTNFEEKLEKFKTGFGRNFDLASRKFDDAIKAIDKSIVDMQKARDSLVRSKDNLRLANDKADGLTIRKLTHKNPTMAARFKDAREAVKLSDAETEVVDKHGNV